MVQDNPKTPTGDRIVYLPAQAKETIQSIRRLNPDGEYIDYTKRIPPCLSPVWGTLHSASPVRSVTPRRFGFKPRHASSFYTVPLSFPFPAFPKQFPSLPSHIALYICIMFSKKETKPAPKPIGPDTSGRKRPKHDTGECRTKHNPGIISFVSIYKNAVETRKGPCSAPNHLETTKKGAKTMNKDINKKNIHPETLGKISGGAGENWEELAKRMYENTDHELESENDITKIPDLGNPHSKISKGKLYKKK